MSNPATFEDAFNLLCGKKLGEGVFREVFECKLKPDCVVKVENAELRYFSNVMEMRVWDDWSHHAAGKWLAPCEFLSPDGRVLLQKRVRILRPEDGAPDTLPEFLTDTKYDNYGWYDGRLVCVDYGSVISRMPMRQRKVEWW